MFKLKKRFFAFLVIASTSTASTLFIGNGGEVFQRETEYYLRDLVESNSYLNPIFNCSSQNVNSDFINNDIVQLLDVDKELLARKLCDVDLVLPNLSKILIQALNIHTWSYIEDELGLLPDDAPLLLGNFKRLQVANRTLYNIRIQRNIWNHLDATNKIALIFHEIIYSLLKLNCANQECSIQKQTARVAREITGLLFRVTTFSNQSEREKLEKLILFSLNSEVSYLKIRAPFLKIRSSIVNLKNETLLSIEKSGSLSDIEYSSFVCENYKKENAVLGPLKISLMILKTNLPELKPISYQTIYGIEYGFKIVSPNELVSKIILPYDAENNCEEAIIKILKVYR